MVVGSGCALDVQLCTPQNWVKPWGTLNSFLSLSIFSSSLYPFKIGFKVFTRSSEDKDLERWGVGNTQFTSHWEELQRGSHWVAGCTISTYQIQRPRSGGPRSVLLGQTFSLGELRLAEEGHLTIELEEKLGPGDWSLATFLFPYESSAKGILHQPQTSPHPVLPSVGVHSPQTCCFSSFLNGHEWHKSKSAFFHSLVDSNFGVFSEKYSLEIILKLWHLQDFYQMETWKKKKISDALLICLEQLVDINPK